MPSPSMTAASGELATLEPEQPVESLEQFLDWYAKIETTVAQGRESKYSQALAVLRNRQRDIGQLLQYVDAVSGNLTDMQHQHRIVEEKTNPIRTMSAQLLQDQAQLQQSVDYLQHDLGYFDDLEPITKLMHAPGEAVCLHANFIPYLRRLVECTEHVQNNVSAIGLFPRLQKKLQNGPKNRVKATSTATPDGYAYLACWNHTRHF
ncbi:Golgi transport complex subunit 3 [Dimargaris verticillata]|uniref:Golgi transport complex subunit 3 n=1 Tax=Dimargaris verticillata TaxID=2761393 RepID=A0A9W8EBI3_9FUNG|nr:Golgi transport complex subunit 3 [Dimargaris verticillata]